LLPKASIAIAMLLFLNQNPVAWAMDAHEKAIILVMGDSISAGYGIQREEGWVNLLSVELAQAEQPYSVVNASISGETTAGGLARLPQALETHDPAVVVIELGGNDGLRGYPTGTIRSNLQNMVELALNQSRYVILVGMQIPPNYGQRYTQAFFTLYADIAEETGATLIPFFLERVALEPELMQGDGIHPTAEAQPLLLETLWNELEPLLTP
jgi:acyl-CoA thioesterase-1